MFAVICLVLMAGFPVAFTLAGTALIFAAVGSLAGIFDPAFLEAVPNRIFGTISNTTLIAVPLFVLMGIILERSRVAEELLHNMAAAFGQRRAGMGISVIIVGALLAASTGIVGATVVTMGLLSLPSMLKQGYSPALATGTICATGTLGQIIPPSIALVLLGDILSSAYQKAQLDMGIFSPQSVSVGDLFVGALIPGLALVALYMLYLLIHATIKPESAPPIAPEVLGETTFQEKIASIIPPVLLIVVVLGSILGGIATPTEAAGVGALGAFILALLKGAVNMDMLRDVGRSTLEVTCMVFMILIGAAVFSLVFRGFGGEELIQHFFEQLPGGTFAAVLVVMLVIFLLGFILDFIEITFVVVPIVAPILLTMGLDPVWLGVMIAINLQTSFLTPPFGFALFYLRGVTDDSVKTATIYRGVIPFIIIQLLMLVLLAVWPEIATWLPSQVGGP
jgi:tripartite ATP-independent transporter DctM subunit